jgi:hypothetical protein
VLRRLSLSVDYLSSEAFPSSRGRASLLGREQTAFRVSTSQGRASSALEGLDEHLLLPQDFGRERGWTSPMFFPSSKTLASPAAGPFWAIQATLVPT